MFRRISRVLPVLLIAVALLPSGPCRAETVTDEIGRRVELSAEPKRIVALTPSLTEILFALDLGSKVVGATTWSDYPEEARELPRVGSYISPNLEQIVALAPDLVLANREGNPPWAVEKLEQAGIPVYVTWPGDPRKLPEGLVGIGRVCGAPQRGRELAEQMQATFDLLDERLKDVQPVPTLLVIGNNPLVSVGADSFHGRLLNMVRAENIAAAGEGNWPRLAMEYIIQAQPEVVVVSTMEIGLNLDKELAFWRNVPAVSAQPGYRVEGIASDLLDRPGPRLRQGVMQLARIVHPDRFPGEPARP